MESGSRGKCCGRERKKKCFRSKATSVFFVLSLSPLQFLTKKNSARPGKSRHRQGASESSSFFCSAARRPLPFILLLPFQGLEHTRSETSVRRIKAAELVASSQKSFWNRRGRGGKKQADRFFQCSAEQRPAGAACFSPPRRRPRRATPSTPGTMSRPTKREFR